MSRNANKSSFVAWFYHYASRGSLFLNNVEFYPLPMMRETVLPHSLTLFLVLLLGIITGANAAQSGNFTYTDNGSDITITGYTGPNENLVIPSFIDSKPVTSIGDDAFYNRSDLTGTLTIPAGITSIGTRAFTSCSGLTGTLSLFNVTSIGDFAFSDCSGFTGSLTTSSLLKTVGKYAFQNCTGFDGILTISGGIESIDIYAFDGCSGFTGSLILPDSLTSIGSSAFRNCSGFNGALMLPSNLTRIPYAGFHGCTGFTGPLTIPSIVTAIGSYAFANCSGFAGSLTLPSGLTDLQDYAFSNCVGLTGSLLIPSGVTTIGDYVFQGCRGFTGSLTILDGVRAIEAGAFSGCSNLTTVCFPSSLIWLLGDQAFANCISLEQAYFESDIPDSIGTDVFLNAASGFKVYYGAGSTGFSSPSWQGYPSQGISSSADYTYIDNGSNITITGYSGSGGDVVIPFSFLGKPILKIDDEVFDNEPTLTSIRIPEGVDEIGVRTFVGCSALTSVELPTTLRTIGAYAFLSCSILDNVTLPHGLTFLGYSSFRHCSSLTSIEIPSTVTTIFNLAFSVCTSLYEVKIQNGVTRIPEGTFRECSALTSIIVPGSVNELGDSAFEDSGLVAIYFDGNAPSIGVDVFAGTASGFNVFYRAGAAGFTSPTWNGYTTAIWAPVNDFDSDGLVDLLLQSKMNLGIIGQRMDGSGGKIGSPQALIPATEEVQFLSMVNMDQTGQNDLLIRNLNGSNTYEVRFRDANGNVTGTKTFDPGAPEWRIVGSYDQNGDGNTDLLWQNMDTGKLIIWYLNARYVRYDFKQVVGSMTDFRVVAVGDMDNDGLMDILWQRYTDSKVSTVVAWYLDGSLQLKTGGGSTTLANIAGGWFCAGLADYNADGVLDIVWQNTDSFQILAWLMNASSAKTGSMTLDSGTSGQYYANWQWDLGTMEPWDFNGDDNADLLWQNSSTAAVQEWYMDDSWGTSSSVEVVASVDAPGQLVSSCDMNGDGINDYIWTYTEGSRQVVLLWEMNVDRTLKSSVVLGKVAAPYEFRAVGDMNSDGNSDILWQASSTGKVIVWYMDGQGTRTSFAALTGRIPIYKVHLVADMNGDGNDDIIWQGRTGANHRIIIWYMDGSGRRSSGANYTAVPKDWTLSNAADYNNDTYTDLIWHNKTSGQAIGWLLDENNVRISHQTIATGITDFDFAHW